MKPKYTEKLVLNSGNVVYKYSEKSLAARKKKKVTRTKNIRKSVSDIISAVSSDILSRSKSISDPAAVVMLILCTYERVGNDLSASEGHFGASNLEKHHVTKRNGYIELDYIAKSGVRQIKPVHEPILVDFILKRINCLQQHDRIFQCSPQQVNDYLDKFDVTSKDIRTFAANRFMSDELKSLGKSHELKTKTQRHAIFRNALDNVAVVIGHKPATLKSMYLSDKLKNSYINDGKIVRR